MDLKPGSRWKSAVCTTEIVIVRSPKSQVALECGGHEMLPHSSQKQPEGGPSKEHASGTQAGKRFADDLSGLELLCTKSGAGSLSIDGNAISAKEAKKLPSSD